MVCVCELLSFVSCSGLWVALANDLITLTSWSCLRVGLAYDLLLLTGWSCLQVALDYELLSLTSCSCVLFSLTSCSCLRVILAYELLLLTSCSRFRVALTYEFPFAAQSNTSLRDPIPRRQSRLVFENFFKLQKFQSFRIEIFNFKKNFYYVFLSPQKWQNFIRL